MTLSPADERGLSHLSLDARLRRTFVELPKGELAELARLVRDQSLERGLVYYRENGPEVINVMLCPRGIFPEQMSYFTTSRSPSPKRSRGCRTST